jgi:large repetitive protein
MNLAIFLKVFSLPSHGTLKLSESSITTNEEIPASNLNSLTYTPDTGYIGSDSFSWNGSDGTLYAATAVSVNITVNDQVG